MITKSKQHNPNYLAKIVKLKNLRKHENADRLQCMTIDFQNVITDLSAKDGDYYVYFPIESKINLDFLSYTNSFRDKELNKDNEKTGFFDKNGRVKAVKLRGEKSEGYIVPFKKVIEWSMGLETIGDVYPLKEEVGKEFDVINNKKIIEKYIVPIKNSVSNNRQGKKPRETRLIDGQVHLHVDTKKLVSNIDNINPDDIISITYKEHGTSMHIHNVLTKKKLNWFEKVLKRVGIPITDTEYSVVYGSRKTVKNGTFEEKESNSLYHTYGDGGDIWKDVAQEIGDKIPKGFSLYLEIVGYDKTGKFIQKDYDYGCSVGNHRIVVYRITQTNADGVVTELTYPEIKTFCDKYDLIAPHLFYYGEAKNLTSFDFNKENDEEEWREHLMKFMMKEYTEKDCFMCENKVPEEGVVLRNENLFSCEVYKLKSFRFLERETKENDLGLGNIEDNN